MNSLTSYIKETAFVIHSSKIFEGRDKGSVLHKENKTTMQRTVAKYVDTIKLTEILFANLIFHHRNLPRLIAVILRAKTLTNIP